MTRTTPASATQIVIPMSGRGARFQAAGYRDIKPLVTVDGVPMIEHVIRMFPGAGRFVFICASDHLANTPLRETLRRLVPDSVISVIVSIEPHKQGPVHAVLQAESAIRDDMPTIVNYCDFNVGWDFEDFCTQMADLDCAGAITAYRGFHPHTLGSHMHAYLRHADNYLLEIREKQCFTDNRMEEYASSGTYYFRDPAVMKRYFREAIALDLRANNEFFCSLPYNLMVRDSLPVYVYELDHFVPLGTPQDVEEYQGWSDYLSRYSDWMPSLPTTPGVNLVPMAGLGDRFRKAGFRQAKPLVPVGGMPMVRRALRSLPSAERWIGACQLAHLSNVALEPTLNADGRSFTTVPVDGPTEGQACSCLLARELIDPDAPLLIAPCDAATVFDERRYAALTSDPNIDCLVWTFRNHPHANRNPRQYGWVRTDAEGLIQGVSCKTPISEDVRKDPGVIGTFWFRKGQFFLDAADALIARDLRVNNEFYVDSSITQLVEQGRRAHIFDVQHYVCFGTPDDVHTYEYWNGYTQSRLEKTVQPTVQPVVAAASLATPGSAR
jgi:NDP-sugar pyrophosphorylase family protein